MSTDLLTSKIELLLEQIDNLEKSGFFTEAEMDRATRSLKVELEQFTIMAKHCEDDKQLYGMNPKEYQEGTELHNQCFDQIKEIDVTKTVVNDTEILTPSTLL